MSIPAYIVMPTISTPSKIAATKGYGANVIFSGSTSQEREAVVADVIAKTGATLIPPYDHPDIMIGQGTAALQFLEQVIQLRSKYQVSRKQEENSKGLHAVIAPCGGGGLLSGTALACQGTGTKVFGAEPEFQGGDDCRRGIAAGERITSVKTLTIADGLRTPVGAFPWKVISNPELVKGVYAVTEEQIKSALRLVLERMKVVVEPSAVVPLAVALFNEDFRKRVEKEAGEEGWDIGVIFSGGNVSLEALGKLFPQSA
jgi:threonine dehydratase